MTFKFVKRFALVAGLAFTLATPAIAEENSAEELTAIDTESDLGTKLDAEVDSELDSAARRRPGWRNPGWRNPGWRNPGRGSLVCYAENRRGEVFQAWGRGRGSWRWTQRAALDQCARYSRGGYNACRALGCR